MLQAGFNATIELTDDDGDDDDDDDEREASAILPIVLGVSAAGVVIALTLVLTLCAVHRCRSRYACTVLHFTSLGTHVLDRLFALVFFV